MSAADPRQKVLRQGDTVYLLATKQSFDGMTGKTGPTPGKGPLTIDKIYRCGEHIRISAHGDGLTKVDAAMSAFRVADKHLPR